MQCGLLRVVTPRMCAHATPGAPSSLPPPRTSTSQHQLNSRACPRCTGSPSAQYCFSSSPRSSQSPGVQRAIIRQKTFASSSHVTVRFLRDAGERRGGRGTAAPSHCTSGVEWRPRRHTRPARSAAANEAQQGIRRDASGEARLLLGLSCSGELCSSKDGTPARSLQRPRDGRSTAPTKNTRPDDMIRTWCHTAQLQLRMDVGR